MNRAQTIMGKKLEILKGLRFMHNRNLNQVNFCLWIILNICRKTI
jgi:hypothetical protein